MPRLAKMKKRSFREIAEFVHARLVGDGAVEVTNISSIQAATPGDLVFVEDEKNLRLALKSRASAVIAGEFAASKKNAKPLLVSATAHGWHLPGRRDFFARRQNGNRVFIPAQS